MAEKPVHATETSSIDYEVGKVSKESASAINVRLVISLNKNKEGIKQRILFPYESNSTHKFLIEKISISSRCF